jgi:hypothetical protein
VDAALEEGSAARDVVVVAPVAGPLLLQRVDRDDPDVADDALGDDAPQLRRSGL